jgi:hypothetical protein
MRFRSPALSFTLPRDLASVASNGATDADSARAPYLEHLSLELLRSLVQNGRRLDEFHIQHLKDCRDCRDFITQFCADARSFGISARDLFPIDVETTDAP